MKATASLTQGLAKVDGARNDTGFLSAESVSLITTLVRVHFVSVRATHLERAWRYA